MIIDEKTCMKRFLKKKYVKCPICNMNITPNDFDIENIGYIKSKLNEVFFHNSCYRKKFIKVVKNG